MPVESANADAGLLGDGLKARLRATGTENPLAASSTRSRFRTASARGFRVAFSFANCLI
jgi:hypothetical protein